MSDLAMKTLAQPDSDGIQSVSESGESSSDCGLQVAAISVSDLFLGYDRAPVLKGVNMNVRPASIYGLLGKKIDNSKFLGDK